MTLNLIRCPFIYNWFQAFDSEWDKNTKGMNPSWKGIVAILIVLAIWLVIR